ncbi:MAG: hypothetical protein AAB930_04765, partial [Patescibacteria group bacterium]
KVFLKAKVISSGNPLWDEFYFPKLSYEESRAKPGIRLDETFVLVVGHKPSAITMPMWSSVLEAFNLDWMVTGRRKWQLVFSRHPGDRVEMDDGMRNFIKDYAAKHRDADNRALDEKEVEKTFTAFEEMSRVKSYQELMKWNAIPARVISAKEVSISDLIPGCDLLIGPASTTEIEAVCQRKPVISLLNVTTSVRLKGVSGGKWELVEEGVTSYVGGEPQYIANSVIDLLEQRNVLCRELRVKQEQLYPKPTEKGVALRAIVSTLREFAKK